MKTVCERTYKRKIGSSQAFFNNSTTLMKSINQQYTFHSAQILALHTTFLTIKRA